MRHAERLARRTTRFNPRPRMGSDCRGDRFSARAIYLFQSTPPHGERRNPQTYPNGLLRRLVSIHAPAWGATVGSQSLTIVRETLFQSTPPHGERRGDLATKYKSLVKLFQSTPPHGERLSNHSRGDSRNGKKRFQSTPPHGERLLT